MTRDSAPAVSLDSDDGGRAREDLLAHLKKEVKQLMEEAVTKRFVHEEGGTVTSLCVAVEACLAHGLKRRLFGLFGATSTFGLLHRISSVCPPAASVVKMVAQIERKYWKARKSAGFGERNESADWASARSKTLPSSFRYLWIRLALFEKVLAAVVERVAADAAKFYEAGALMRDPVSASMVAALLVGPCALEYSKMKTLDHYWTDPPAEELLQRHRIHSRPDLYAADQAPTPDSPRLSLRVKRTESLGPDETSQKLSSSAREYVTSLHQNAKADLLYGKNGVVVWPPGARRPMKGYLSLHQNLNGSLTIKWTPNELMHGGSTESIQPNGRGQLWQHAINLDVRDIVYLHCHQRGETEGSIVFVGADGTQYPPVEFPLGQHPLAFLSCLENGMLPRGRLDPPLWLHKGKGKVFPKLKRRSSFTDGRTGEAAASDRESDENTDYVFRVITMSRPWRDDSSASPSPNKPPATVPGRLVNLSGFSMRLKERFLSLNSSPACSPPATPERWRSEQHSPVDQSPRAIRRNGFNADHDGVGNGAAHPPELVSQMSAPAVLDDVQKSPSRRKLRSACDSMRHQILSRAFYGWLAHCRHVKTIRTHLIRLVDRPVVPPTSESLTEESWKELRSKGEAESECEFHRRVYFGNVPHSLRKCVWPFLLGLYPWTADERATAAVYEELRAKYEGLLTEWTAAEAIVRERDREAFKAARDSARPAPAAVAREDAYDESDGSLPSPVDDSEAALTMEPLETRDYLDDQWRRTVAAITDMAARSPCPSTPEEGEGGLFSKEQIDAFAVNLHRIEKDVHRCDRNHPYFVSKNLEKLKNIMCAYVWENLHWGYVQGMCDLCAPLLVLFDDEVLAYGCFSLQMKRLAANFPHGGGMDAHLANARALLQVLDPELFDLMRQNGDYTHFYFSYRWFLLDFKRELSYEDVFRVWEVIWASPRVSSSNFVLFLVMATVELYRDIILDNNMDFTDAIKFFNEMAEKHDAAALLELARGLVLRLQKAVEK